MKTSTLNPFLRLVSASTLLCALLFVSAFSIQGEEDVSVEALYPKAMEFNSNGQYEEASKTFERIFDLSGGVETLFEDFGAQAGGLIFDYGMTLLPQQRWEEAKKAFTDCIDAARMAEAVQSPVRSTNPREKLAKFQLGYCEAQLGNHDEAIKLYDEYLASEPAPDELAQVRNSFKLRYGASLMKVGRSEEGVASFQELFDNSEAWKVTPQFLMQAILELGLAYIDQANAMGDDDAAVDRITEQAHDFLDKNAGLIHLEPLTQFRFGFVDRLRKLGFESTKAGLYSLALRYFSYLPTIEDIRTDLYLSVERQAAGMGIPSQFQAILDQLDEREKAPIHPDAETLRLVANCYERMGNTYAPRAIYWDLVEQYPDVDKSVRGELLHEAARFSSAIQDYSAAQYFGEKFMDEMALENPLRNNVSTFMLQSLFTSQAYDQVIATAETVREREASGSAERELADALYPLALYATKQYDKAEGPFNEYVKAYPEGSNREIVLYQRASNSLIMNKMREAAEQYEDFLKAYPESERFLDAALADLAIARFNLEDYTAAIAATDRIVEARPKSIQLARTLNLKGDAKLIQASAINKDQKEEAEELRKQALESYLAAVEAGKAALAIDPQRKDFHRLMIAEGIWKSADQYYQNGEIDKGLAQYDAFFPDYAGTHYEPQISVFSLEYLEGAGRGEEGLTQVEKMILFLGSRPAEEQDITLLRQALGSYSEASVRIRGLDKTLATLEDFPGLEPSNQALLTWIKIQQVIVLQESRKGMERDSAEYAAVESKIAKVFEDLRLFEKRELSEFALQQIGLYFAGTDNPFLGVPYFEELLARTNPESEHYKAPAEMELGKIEMRSPDEAAVNSARERFRRIIAADNEDSRALRAQAYLNLADLNIRKKDWKEAHEALDAINKNKSFFDKDREKRAEAGYKLGVVRDALGDPVGASEAYLSVISAYAAYHDWMVQSWERYVANSRADIEGMPLTDPLSIALQRSRYLSLYKLCVKYLYQWQAWSEETDVPSGALTRLRRDVPAMKDELKITPEEELKILTELGLAPRK